MTSETPGNSGEAYQEGLTEWVQMARVRQTYLNPLRTPDLGGGFKLKLLGGHEWGPDLTDEEIATYCETYECANLDELYARAQEFFFAEGNEWRLPR